MHSKDTKEMFKQIPTTMSKPLIPKQTFKKLMTEIVDGCYIEKVLRDYHH